MNGLAKVNVLLEEAVSTTLLPQQICKPLAYLM